MSKNFYILIIAVLLTATTFAQAPEQMSYQAIVRNNSEVLVSNQAVGMQISILQGSVNGTAVYVETHAPTTNLNGLVTLEIGTGTVVVGDFIAIDWSADTYFIKTETDLTGGSSYTITGTSQLMSVPYALHAKTAESITGTVQYTETDPVFGASVANQITSTDITNWNNHTVDTDTQLDAAGITALGFVAEKTYTIGLWPELGGYIFWVSADGKHGLVAETQDQCNCRGYDSQNAVSDPANHSANGQKFRDWRLPTLYELNEMYVQRNNIGGFNAFNKYWVSLIFFNANDIYQGVQDFSNGVTTSESSVQSINYVRSVRTF